MYKERTFTTKEFPICFTFLPAIRNHVYVKGRTVPEIWGHGFIRYRHKPSSNNIKKIREKVEMDTSNPQKACILRRYGELDTGSRYRTEHIFRITDRLYMGGRHGSLQCFRAFCSKHFRACFPGRQETG